MAERFIEYMRLELLQRATRNPKDHDRPAISASLKRFGYVEAITLDERTGQLVAGHGRLDELELAASEAEDPPEGITVDGDGHWLVPVQRGWSSADDAEAEAYLLASNLVGEGLWHRQALADVLTDLQAGPGLEGIGYDSTQLDALLASLNPPQPVAQTDPDEAPEVPTVPVTKPGDVWLLGPHRLVCGDATDPAAVELALAGQRAALCFTSPPYADVREYHGGDLSPKHLAQFLPVVSAHAALIVVNLGIVRREGAYVRYWDDYIAAAEQAGLKLLSWNVWDRAAPWSMAQQTAMFPVEHEWLLVFGAAPVTLNRTVENKTGGMIQDTGNRQPDGSVTRRYGVEVHSHRPIGTVTRMQPALGLTETGGLGHPAMFPVALPTSYLEAATQRGEIVLDPFAGAGTTAIAAHRTGRVAALVELSPAYVDTAAERFQRHAGVVPVLEATGEPHDFTAAARPARPQETSKKGS